MNSIVKTYQKVVKYPLGKHIFTRQVANRAPYFKTLRALINDIKPHYAEVTLKKRKIVTNHIGTVHAIAMCNMCELAMGMAAESSIPSDRRWIPMGMNVNYLKKAETDLKATCDLSKADWYQRDVDCFVSVRNTEDVEVMNATIKLRVTDKK